MPIWETSRLDRVPIIAMSCWQIMLVDDTDIHFVGYNVTEGEGRVSSAIVDFDQVNMTGRSVTGRIYELLYSAAPNVDATYVWNQWLKLNKVTNWMNITHQYEIQKQSA